MDRTERINPRSANALLVTIKAALEQFEAGLWTALPATVNSFNAGALTVEAQPTIQAQVLRPNGIWVNTTLPLCVDCPVMFPGGGGFLLTFPIVKGDEGILVFASRCIDSWWQSGGVQKQAELRMHDLSDGFFFPTGGLSQPNVAGNVSTNTAQLRSKDGLTYVELAGGNIINIVAPGNINITGNLILTGNFQLSGNILSKLGGTYTGDIKTAGNITAGFGTGDQVGLTTHTHTQPADSHGDVEAAISAPTAGT